LWTLLPYHRTRLRRFEISPEEAMTLYLATRLLVKQHDKRNESAETALVKLAEVLIGDTGVGQEIYQAASRQLVLQRDFILRRHSELRMAHCATHCAMTGCH